MNTEDVVQKLASLEDFHHLNVILNVACAVMLAVLVVMHVSGRVRFNKHLRYVERKTDEYLTIMKRVGALVTGRMGEAARTLERTGDKLEHKVVEASQEVKKDIIETITVTEQHRFSKSDTKGVGSPPSDTGKLSGTEIS